MVNEERRLKQNRLQLRHHNLYYNQQQLRQNDLHLYQQLQQCQQENQTQASQHEMNEDEMRDTDTQRSKALDETNTFTTGTAKKTAYASGIARAGASTTRIARTAACTNDFNAEVALQVTDLTMKWEQGDVTEEQYFTALAKIVSTKNVINDI